jgi:hypothetical protein
MLKDIFQGTPQHEYYMELARDEVLPQVRAQVHEEVRQEGREEGRQALLQVQRKTLLKIVQARFPTLVRAAKTQAKQIKDGTVMEEVIGRVGMAQTLEEAMNALLDWQESNDADE